MNRTGYFLIADISGYTDFLAGSELEHAQGIMQSLLTVLVESIAPPLQLAKFEGDAIFCHAAEERIARPHTILDGIEDIYCRFATELERIRLNTTCPCQACRRAGDLDLKFVLHHGEYAEQSIAGRKELTGTDVIVVHRLMKNRIREATGTHAYLFVTDQAAKALGAEGATKDRPRHEETIEGIGKVGGTVMDMMPLWAERRESTRAWIAPGEPLWFPAIGCTLPISAAAMWSYLLDRDQRLRWIDGMTGMTFEGREDGRMGRGTMLHCAHGKEKLDFEIVDWRPFQTVSMDLGLPFGAVTRTTYEIKETADGVQIEARLKPVRGGQGALGRLLIKPMLAMASGKVRKSFIKSFNTLDKVVADDITAGKIERWSPARAAAF